MRRWWAAVAVLVLMFLAAMGGRAGTPSLASQAVTRVLFVLDASSSMREPLGDRSKLAVAKEALSAVVREIPNRPDVEVGLRVYGSQKEPFAPGDCEDTQLLLPLTGVADGRGRLLELVDKVEARGSTPISLALERAAQDFPPGPGQRIVVLVTDGVETCWRDPCAISSDLQARGLLLKPYVVGFGTDARANERLRCIGELYTSDSASSLGAALRAILAQATGAPPPPDGHLPPSRPPIPSPPPTPPEPSAPTPGQLEVRVFVGIRPAAARVEVSPVPAAPGGTPAPGAQGTPRSSGPAAPGGPISGGRAGLGGGATSPDPGASWTQVAAVPDQPGLYRLSLPAGAYRVRVTPTSPVLAPRRWAEVVVAAGQTRQLTAEFPPTGWLQVVPVANGRSYGGTGRAYRGDQLVWSGPVGEAAPAWELPSDTYRLVIEATAAGFGPQTVYNVYVIPDQRQLLRIPLR